MKYKSIIYDVKLGKQFGKTAHFEAENEEGAVRLCVNFVRALTKRSRKGHDFAFTKPEEDKEGWL